MKLLRLLPYLAAGTLFGIVLTKTEVISWFRIQEMFHFKSFHMYGVIGSAVAVGALSLFLMRKLGIKTAQGQEVKIDTKSLGTGRRYILGGTVFGLGWGLVGACPGPMFALIGNGFTVAIVILLSATVGTRTYAALHDKLPH
ncbi:MAG: DUF6691 family protein [Planctomycetota bacterium]|jgi:uncharacterized membrane protein YedE/YeeE